MDSAKIFQTGRSQAVRLPKAYRFAGKEVYIKKTDQGVLLIPKEDAWSIVEAAVSEFERGFKVEREQAGNQSRPELRK
ncbi:type II toxin-antitoxin system VapB family antitoxin [beta proteobacterium MWH-UniP1]